MPLVLECFVMFLFSYVWIHSMLDLLKMILLMFFGIWKIRVKYQPMKTRVKYQPLVIMERAHLSQPKIVGLFGVYTFSMSIAGIRHVDS